MTGGVKNWNSHLYRRWLSARWRDRGWVLPEINQFDFKNTRNKILLKLYLLEDYSSEAGSREKSSTGDLAVGWRSGDLGDMTIAGSRNGVVTCKMLIFLSFSEKSNYKNVFQKNRILEGAFLNKGQICSSWILPVLSADGNVRENGTVCDDPIRVMQLLSLESKGFKYSLRKYANFWWKDMK